jgi:hypothetical protein
MLVGVYKEKHRPNLGCPDLSACSLCPLLGPHCRGVSTGGSHRRYLEVVGRVEAVQKSMHRKAVSRQPTGVVGMSRRLRQSICSLPASRGAGTRLFVSNALVVICNPVEGFVPCAL